MNTEQMHEDPVAQINAVVLDTETVAQTLNVSEINIVHVDQEVATLGSTAKSMQTDGQNFAREADNLDTAGKVYTNTAEQNYAGASIAPDENQYNAMVSTGDTATTLAIQSSDNANSFATRAIQADTGSAALELIKNIQIAVAETINTQIQSEIEVARQTNATVEQEMKTAQVIAEEVQESATAAQANEPNPTFTQEQQPSAMKIMMG